MLQFLFDFVCNFAYVCFMQTCLFFGWSCTFLVNEKLNNCYSCTISNYIKIRNINYSNHGREIRFGSNKSFKKFPCIKPKKKKIRDKMADLPVAILEEKWLWWPPYLIFVIQIYPNRHTSIFSILVVLRSAQFKGHTCKYFFWAERFYVVPFRYFGSFNLNILQCDCSVCRE